LSRSLSLIFSVFNAQESLAPTLAELLELLPELTTRFEVQLIDDGSLDATMELAAEQVKHYPQVRLLAHPAKLGMRICVETGMRNSSADWVLYRASDCQLDLQGIAKLWKQSGEFDCLLGRRAGHAPLGWIPKLPAQIGSSGPEHDGMILARRAVFNQWLNTPPQQTFETHLVRSGVAWKAVDLRAKPQVESTQKAVPRPRIMRQTVLAGGDVHGNAGPDYLRKFTEFALGE
jgi:glycosyltransferase involved in cell wall biosynthesis